VTHKRKDTRVGPLSGGAPLPLGLRLLDHQLVGAEQELLGNVDDVALEEREGQLFAVAVLRGPGAWANRQPGAMGRWGRAVWRRLHSEEDPAPVSLRLDHVVSIGSAVEVDPWAASFLAGTDGLELWLRRHVVGKIPGARGGEHPFGGSDLARSSAPGDQPVLPGPLLSALLGAQVTAGDGSDAGRVVEVRAVQDTALTSRVGPLRVTSIVHGPHRLGGELGYREDTAMGPAALGASVRWWHRHDTETPWEAVHVVGWATSQVQLRTDLRR